MSRRARTECPPTPPSRSWATSGSDNAVEARLQFAGGGRSGTRKPRGRARVRPLLRRSGATPRQHTGTSRQPHGQVAAPTGASVSRTGHLTASLTQDVKCLVPADGMPVRLNHGWSAQYASHSMCGRQATAPRRSIAGTGHRRAQEGKPILRAYPAQLHRRIRRAGPQRRLRGLQERPYCPEARRAVHLRRHSGLPHRRARFRTPDDRCPAGPLHGYKCLAERPLPERHVGC